MAISVIPYLRWKKPDVKRSISAPLPLVIFFLIVCVFLILIPFIDGENDAGRWIDDSPNWLARTCTCMHARTHIRALTDIVVETV